MQRVCEPDHTVSHPLQTVYCWLIRHLSVISLVFKLGSYWIIFAGHKSYSSISQRRPSEAGLFKGFKCSSVSCGTRFASY